MVGNGARLVRGLEKMIVIPMRYTKLVDMCVIYRGEMNRVNTKYHL